MDRILFWRGQLLSASMDLFEKFYPRDDIKNFGRRVREFCESNDGTVWIGTEDKGLFHFYPESGKIENSHILLFIKMFMVYVWTVMICG